MCRTTDKATGLFVAAIIVFLAAQIIGTLLFAIVSDNSLDGITVSELFSRENIIKSLSFSASATILVCIWLLFSRK